MIARIETEKIWNGGELTHDMYNELQTAMSKTAEKVAVEAKSRVAVGEGKPMHLRETIRARAGKRGKLKAVLHAAVSGEYQKALPVAYVFAGDRLRYVYWAHFVEYGTYFRSAHPFLRPAMNSNFNALIAETEHYGQRVINMRRRQRKHGKGHA